MKKTGDTMTRIAVNGMGRIGRATLKIILDQPELELVAVNDLMDIDTLSYLLRFDTVYGRYDRQVETREDSLIVDGRKIVYLREKDPTKLPWKEMNIDIVFECTGMFTRRQELELHLGSGARLVILSAPAKDEDIPTVVHGANIPDNHAAVISCGSCTTNCITPVIEIIGRRIGIRKAIMTTVHAYTGTQALVDNANKKLRRGRAAAANLVPTSTGAAIATTKVLPQLKGLFNGIAVRAPVPAGSVADIVVLAQTPTTVEKVNTILKEEAQTIRYLNILGVSDDALVSSDIIGDPHAAVVDLEMTQVVDGDLLKIVSWYDNEWGYSNQMVREALRISYKKKSFR